MKATYRATRVRRTLQALRIIANLEPRTVDPIPHKHDRHRHDHFIRYLPVGLLTRDAQGARDITPRSTRLILAELLHRMLDAHTDAELRPLLHALADTLALPAPAAPGPDNVNHIYEAGRIHEHGCSWGEWQEVLESVIESSARPWPPPLPDPEPLPPLTPERPTHQAIYTPMPPPPPLTPGRQARKDKHDSRYRTGCTLRGHLLADWLEHISMRLNRRLWDAAQAHHATQRAAAALRHWDDAGNGRGGAAKRHYANPKYDAQGIAEACADAIAHRASLHDWPPALTAAVGARLDAAIKASQPDGTLLPPPPAWMRAPEAASVRRPAMLTWHEDA